MKNDQILEGMLFIKGEEGLSSEDILNLLEINNEELNLIIDRLKKFYIDNNRGIRLELFGNRYKLVSSREYKKYYEKLVESENNVLTQSTLETLAIIAYNNPITRIKVDEIRGVSSAHIMRKLLRMEFIKDIGKSDLPGRPYLYSITDKFLDYFGLSSINDLPKLDDIEINNTDTETDLFLSKYNEN